MDNFIDDYVNSHNGLSSGASRSATGKFPRTICTQCRHRARNWADPVDPFCNAAERLPAVLGKVDGKRRFVRTRPSGIQEYVKEGRRKCAEINDGDCRYFEERHPRKLSVAKFMDHALAGLFIIFIALLLAAWVWGLFRLASLPSEPLPDNPEINYAIERKVPGRR